MPAILMTLAFASSDVTGPAKLAAQSPMRTQSLELLTKEYEANQKAWSIDFGTAYEKAKKDGKKDSFRFDRPAPGLAYSPRFLAIAEKDPTGPEALDALEMTLQTNPGQYGKPSEIRARAIKILVDHYVTSPKILKVIKLLARRTDENDARAFIDQVIARNPDRMLQAKAYLARAEGLATPIRFEDTLKKDAVHRAYVEKTWGKGVVTEGLAAGEKARAEKDAIGKILREKYADIVTDLPIGIEMPPLVSEDLEGKTTSLADLKGKVVVLDIWATWCGPCKAMIPHEREMIARLKDKPFTLVSISVDAEKKTLTDFLAKEPMPWHHWWNGAEGKLIDALSIQHYPTIFVLDAKGVIRYKEIRGEELEKAVNELLEETEKKTARQKIQATTEPAKAA